MSGRESLIGAGLAVVLVVGIVDAAVGHDDSSKSTPATPVPISTTTDVLPPSPSSSPTMTESPGSDGTMGITSPASTTATAPAPAPSATHSKKPRSTTAAATAPSATQSPPAGVLGTFSYATTGGEGTSIPGTQRDFPKTTKITNKLGGCGVVSTWKPIPEHVQKQVLCPVSDGIKVASQQTMISFYGVSSGEKFKCSGPSYVYREGLAAGDSWRFKCKAPDAVATQKSTVIGFESVSVGGTTVRTLHVHVDTKITGDSSGTSNQDYWIATKKPVLVKETGKINATQQSVHYTSSYSLALKSLSPKT